MLDSLLGLLERVGHDSKKSSSQLSGGLRGRLSTMLEDDHDDDRSSTRKKRAFDFLDFGD